VKNIVVDYESFYDTKAKVSVTSLGNPNYVQATDAYILAVAFDGEAVAGTIEEIGKYFGDGFWSDPEHQFWAANSNFDQAWHEKYYPKTAHPWKCILDLGAFHQMPRNLSGLAGVALGKKVDKTLRDEMDGVDYWSLDEARKTDIQNYCLGDATETLRILQTLPSMTDVEDKLAAHTRMCNRRGVVINTDLVDEDKGRLEVMKWDAFKRIPWHANAKPLSPVALGNFCRSIGVPVPRSVDKNDPECAALCARSHEFAEVIGSLRTFRKANTMLEKCATLRERLVDGVLPLDLIYCAAPHTRRWSSRGFNIQNLDRSPIPTGNVEDVWTRRWLTPRPGKTFLILDYAQIEPRCLNWMVGNEPLLEAMRAGYSVYEAYAIACKGWRGAPGTLKKEFGIASYTRIKNEVLGLGYGMGAPKYSEYANLTEEEAKLTVAAFRRDNPGIPAMWKRFDTLIKDAYNSHEKNLALELPNGESLYHFGVRAKTTTKKNGEAQRGGLQSTTVINDFSAGSVQSNLWGGVLTENVTQRMARDVLGHAILRLEESGLAVVFHAHDEVILEVDLSDKEEAKEAAVRIMTKPPAWAEDLPLGVEGDFADSYTK
jgi:hypothetical protein